MWRKVATVHTMAPVYLGVGGHGGGVRFGTAGLSILTAQLSISDPPVLSTGQTQWNVGGSESPSPDIARRRMDLNM